MGGGLNNWKGLENLLKIINGGVESQEGKVIYEFERITAILGKNQKVLK